MAILQNVSPESLKTHSSSKLTNTDVVITSLCAGAIAGALAKTIIAPLDRTKINFQIGHKPYSTRNAWLFLTHTYKNEGFFALWRGNSATMARIIPYAAIQFTAYEQWKRVLIVDPAGTTPGKQFLAGSLAGATSQSLTYPLDMARARMAVTNTEHYKTLREVFWKIYRTEGLITFYRGYIPTILGVIPYAGVSFFTYDTLKRFCKENFKNNPVPTPVVSLGIGAIAGMLGQTSSYPLDIVRRRMQTDSQGRYKTIVDTLQQVYISEGFKRGFFKGLSMNWIKGPIAVGISFATYDNIRDSLRKIVSKYK